MSGSPNYADAADGVKVEMKDRELKKQLGRERTIANRESNLEAIGTGVDEQEERKYQGQSFGEAD